MMLENRAGSKRREGRKQRQQLRGFLAVPSAPLGALREERTETTDRSNTWLLRKWQQTNFRNNISYSVNMFLLALTASLKERKTRMIPKFTLRGRSRAELFSSKNTIYRKGNSPPIGEKLMIKDAIRSACGDI